MTHLFIRSRTSLLKSSVLTGLTLFAATLIPSFQPNSSYAQTSTNSQPEAVRDLESSEGNKSIAPFHSAKELSGAFQGVARQITPSVVSIIANFYDGPQQGRTDSGNQPPHRRDPRRELLEHFGFQLPPSQFEEAPRRAGGFGSGVIMDKSGHILTNYHVVGDASQVSVNLYDKRVVVATIIGTDPQTDLAVIKIEADNLVPAKFGDSDKLSIGEWVIAAGSPFGLEQTITAGIVSAKSRTNVMDRSNALGKDSYQDFIQTDAAINPGNSGGPLVNLNSEVIGINSMILATANTQAFMGVGFAIPINLAGAVANSIIKEGRVKRGWLGILIQELTVGLARSYGRDSANGALVSQITPGGPADSAGLRREDIVTHINETAISDVNHLRNFVALQEPGSTVAVRVFRDGKEAQLKVTLGELPTSEDPQVTRAPITTDAKVGLRLEALTPEIAKQIGTSSRTGAVITFVEPGSPAEAAGLRGGDLVKRIGTKEIKDLNTANETLSKVDLAEGVRMIVETQGVERFVFLEAR